MRAGERVVFLGAEHSGEIVRTSKDGLIYVWRDDRPDDHPCQPRHV